MPRGYDFSVRNVNWRDYKKDFILRTDAVWEKSKLKDMFYASYKVTPSPNPLRTSSTIKKDNLTNVRT